MSKIREQIDWWKRQHCSNSACQLESEIPGFIHTVEKLLAVYEAVVPFTGGQFPYGVRAVHIKELNDAVDAVTKGEALCGA